MKQTTNPSKIPLTNPFHPTSPTPFSHIFPNWLTGVGLLHGFSIPFLSPSQAARALAFSAVSTFRSASMTASSSALGSAFSSSDSGSNGGSVGIRD